MLLRINVEMKASVRNLIRIMTVCAVASISNIIIFEQKNLNLFIKNADKLKVEGDDGSNMNLSRILRHSVFLNAFFPEEKNKYQEALAIVGEQLEQISKSFAASNTHSTKINVYVQAIGNPFFNMSVLNNLCAKMNKIQCHMSGYVKEGGEIDTLALMHQHCGKVPDPNIARATYLHNKGSMHKSKSNNIWRRILTDAALSQQCSHPPNTTCNVCGLQFAAPPGMFTNLFPGNMFTARCDYVNQLLNPREFLKKQTDIVRKALWLGDQGRFHFKEKDHKAYATGLRRYAPEHYIASHPYIVPCDLSKETDWWYWRSNVPHTSSEFEWAMFPRYKQFNVSATTDPKLPDFLLNESNSDKRIRAYTYLAGLIFRHIQLYNMTPPLNSWMFDWLPDGKFWRTMLQRHEKSVLDVVINLDFNRTADTIAKIAESP